MTAPCKHEHDISHNGVHWQHRNATKQIPSTPRDTVKTHTRIMTQTDSRWQIPYVVHWPWARQPCACRHTSIIESSSSSLAISLNFSLGDDNNTCFLSCKPVVWIRYKARTGITTEVRDTTVTAPTVYVASYNVSWMDGTKEPLPQQSKDFALGSVSQEWTQRFERAIPPQQ